MVIVYKKIPNILKICGISCAEAILFFPPIFKWVNPNSIIPERDFFTNFRAAFHFIAEKYWNYSLQYSSLAHFLDRNYTPST